jgi:hypothetical protein
MIEEYKKGDDEFRTMFIDYRGIAFHLERSWCQRVRGRADHHSDTASWVTCDVIRSVFGNAPESGAAKPLKVPMVRFGDKWPGDVIVFFIVSRPGTPDCFLEHFLRSGEVLNEF